MKKQDGIKPTCILRVLLLKNFIKNTMFDKIWLYLHIIMNRIYFSTSCQNYMVLNAIPQRKSYKAFFSLLSIYRTN